MKQWALTKDQDWNEGEFADGLVDLDMVRVLGIPENQSYYQS